MCAVRSIVFDVGSVLVDLDYRPLLNLFRAHGLAYDSKPHLLEMLQLDPYEKGEISDDQFLRHVASLLLVPAEPEAIREAWLGIFSPVPSMLQYARALCNQMPVYLLSNTSPLHWSYVCRTYELSKLSHGCIASHDVGCRKPEAGIYRAAEAKFDLVPDETVFVDDIEENVNGARACGWHGVHHTGVETTQDALRRLGVEVQ